MCFREKLTAYMTKHDNSPESIENITLLFEELICEELKYNHPELFEEFMEEFNAIVDDISEDEIIMAVSHMCKKDGTKGAKWTRDETDNIIQQFNLHEKAGKKFENIWFWFAMNYAFATHGAPNKTISAYIDLALDEMFDKNVCMKKKVRTLNEKEHKTHTKGHYDAKI